MVPVRDLVFTAAILTAILSVVGWVAVTEYRGYCISDYTCTANITPKAFR